MAEAGRSEGCIREELEGGRTLAVCSHPGCTVRAHCHVVDNDRKIFSHPSLCGMPCFDIAHSSTYKGRWNNGRTGSKIYSVSLSHPVYNYLTGEYGVPKRTRKNNKRKAGKEEWDEGMRTMYCTYYHAC